MNNENSTIQPRVYDVIVIGAGICGIIFLKYAREKGLNCLVLEKENEIGGVWRWIPAWQDIQNRRKDFAINGIPLKGVKQPAIHQYIREWVRKYDLEPFIRLLSKVISLSWKDEIWQVRTDHKTFQSRYLIAASGVQNKPWIPAVKRSESGIVEKHSSDLRRPEDLEKKRVTVVGGGASSWDLLDLAIQQESRDIHWVYRNIRWFIPTFRKKHQSWPNIRELALVQTIEQTPEKVNAFLRWLLKIKFDFFRLNFIMPAEPYDLKKHQLIPGRSLMTRNLNKITRHQSEVRLIEGNKISLNNGESFETDLLLWATGFRMNLKYLSLPEYNQISTLDELTPKLGSLVRSMDYSNLFFLGMSLNNSTTSTPFFVAIESKSIVAHIMGKCVIPKKNVPHLVNHWDLFKFFAAFDHYNYPKFWWKIKYFLLAWWYVLFRNQTIRI